MGKYYLLAVGILVIGMPVLLPSIYRAINGGINIIALFFITIGVTMISDFVWYMVGRQVKPDTIYKWRMFRKRKPFIDHLNMQFSQRSRHLLFFSRFAYGTKVIIETLCGMHRMPFFSYFWINITSSFVWLFMIVGLGYVLHATLGSLEHIVDDAKIIFTVFFVVLIAFNIGVGRITRREL